MQNKDKRCDHIDGLCQKPTPHLPSLDARAASCGMPAREKIVPSFFQSRKCSARVAMTVKISYNKGKTWRREKLSHAGPSAYSNLVQLPNGNPGCLYEGIVFEEVTLDGFEQN